MGLARRRFAGEALPDRLVQRDEIGAGRASGRRLDRFGISHAGRFEDLRPPADPFDEPSARQAALLRRHAARRTSHSPLPFRLQTSHRRASASPPAPTIRSGFRLSSAASSASPAPPTWTPSAPSRAASRASFSRNSAQSGGRRNEGGAGRSLSHGTRRRARGGRARWRPARPRAPRRKSCQRRRRQRRQQGSDEIERAAGRVLLGQLREWQSGAGTEMSPTIAAKSRSRQALETGRARSSVGRPGRDIRRAEPAARAREQISLCRGIAETGARTYLGPLRPCVRAPGGGCAVFADSCGRSFARRDLHRIENGPSSSSVRAGESRGAALYI